ncbi:McrB family protein [Pseudobutyrivibrio ruminis]|uniref:McrB family protein n=1 Tax=Pseudobutyrivibrio ruminis TaxID=46206 RepID=UPI00068FD7E9|nr:AAA family ATPase [Pseudobutyrivibrio ruminis]
MSNNVSVKIDSEIDSRLKRIMQQRNIHNETTDKADDNTKIEKEELFIKRNPRKNKIHPINQIIYGAPGTGKTYSTVEYAVAIIENRQINNNPLTPDERKELIEKYEFYMNRGQITFTTFHQSYGYEEFIQGIRPIPAGDTINFGVVDGVFKKISDVAIGDMNNNYVIIIDEINRGNISKIFGELITLIEEDKRWGELNQMSVTLPMGQNFAVPNNLYIIGTMNSADKSISLIDAALRRRFEFVEMAPNPAFVSDEKLRNVLKSLNEYLRKEQRSTDLLIGHSYFIGKTIIEIEPIMNRCVIPLLYEYFYDDESKIKKALECIKGTGYEIDDSSAGRIKVKKEEG